MRNVLKELARKTKWKSSNRELLILQCKELLQDIKLCSKMRNACQLRLFCLVAIASCVLFKQFRELCFAHFFSSKTEQLLTILASNQRTPIQLTCIAPLQPTKECIRLRYSLFTNVVQVVF